jgi:glycosyltransferase involved in cell wall biosynthesis
MKALYLILRAPAAKVYRWLRRHPRQVVLLALVVSIAPEFFLTGTLRQVGTYLSIALLIGLVLFQISSSNRRRLENLLTRYMYQGGSAPVYNKQLLHTIEFNFVAQNKTFESVWLIQKFGIIDEVRTFYVAKLARQLSHRGYFKLSMEFYQIAANRKGGQSYSEEIAALQKRVDMIGSNFKISLPKTKIKPIQGRVLHVVKQTILDRQAGYTIRTHKIARAQAALGVDVHVVGQYGFGNGIAEKVVDGVTYHSLANGKNVVHGSDMDWFNKNTKALAALAKELRPEYLHAASDFMNAAAANIAGHSLGIKVIYELRGFWEETFISGFNNTFGNSVKPLDAAGNEVVPDNYALRQASEAKWALAADYVLTLAPTMQERIESYGVPAKKISLVPNAVDPDEFKPLVRDNALVEKLGLTKDHLIVGYISSLSSYEGVDLLIEAVARLKRENPKKKIALVVVGGGKELDNLKQLAAATKLPEIMLLGQVPHTEVTSYYSIIDIFVVPRLPYEVCHLVTPLKPYEAMAMAKTLVMSDVRALAAIAAESNAALTFEAGNPDSLKDVLLKLANDPKLRKQLGDRATKWVRKDRTWKQIAKVTVDVYAKLRKG